MHSKEIDEKEDSVLQVAVLTREKAQIGLMNRLSEKLCQNNYTRIDNSANVVPKYLQIDVG